MAVLITVLAATAPAIPSKMIIKPAKYIAASPKFLLSLYKDLLVDDPKKETYKIHLLVPVQIIEMLKEKDENTKG